MKIVIMAGGKGTRFWPLSNEEKPKQFRNIYSSKSMLQETYTRFRAWVPAEKIFVLTKADYIPIIQEQLPELMLDQIIVEPAQRDTAACVCLTALYFQEREDDEPLVFSPSDQYISDAEELKEVLQASNSLAYQDKAIVTLGLKPTRPETQYGYMITSDRLNGSPAYQVDCFVEKPSFERALELCVMENVFWNSGIFVMKPSTILYYMAKFEEEMLYTIMDYINGDKESYLTLNKISVDYAIVEKADIIYMIPAYFQWDDVGSWSSLDRTFTNDQTGNIVLGNVHSDGVKNCIIHSDQKAVVIGVEDLIIVSTESGLLICNKSEEGKIKNIIGEHFK
ncbi:mannose-1-phosphate guanylyltransferase [Pontibacillus salicampi]|uniref:Mannose-1-phosphate guanylyltransferase n=1 Tax=Pontibacillus salicampi TaxID=1449801 RepID=A0ABV6LQ62_9BACI